MAKFKIFTFAAWSLLLLVAVACRAAYAAEAVAGPSRLPITMTFENDTGYAYSLTKYAVTGCNYYGTTDVTVPAKTTVTIIGHIDRCGNDSTRFTIRWNFKMYDVIRLPVESGTWQYQITNVFSDPRQGKFITDTSDYSFGRTAIRHGRMSVAITTCGNTSPCSALRNMDAGDVDLYVKTVWVGMVYKTGVGGAGFGSSQIN